MLSNEQIMKQMKKFVQKGRVRRETERRQKATDDGISLSVDSVMKPKENGHKVGDVDKGDGKAMNQIIKKRAPSGKPPRDPFIRTGEFG